MTTPHVRTEVITKGSFEPLIRGLSNKTQRGVLRRSLRRAAQQTVLKVARANVKKVAGGKHAKAVVVKSIATNKAASAKIGAKKESDWGKLGHLFELGTKAHITQAGRTGPATRTRPPSGKKVMSGNGIIYGTTVLNPGMRKRPWLAPAWALQKMPAVNKFGQFIVEEIDKAIAKGQR
jgi:hypothetical protein